MHAAGNWPVAFKVHQTDWTHCSDFKSCKHLLQTRWSDQKGAEQCSFAMCWLPTSAGEAANQQAARQANVAYPDRSDDSDS